MLHSLLDFNVEIVSLIVVSEVRLWRWVSSCFTSRSVLKHVLNQHFDDIFSHSFLVYLAIFHLSYPLVTLLNLKGLWPIISVVNALKSCDKLIMIHEQWLTINVVKIPIVFKSSLNLKICVLWGIFDWCKTDITWACCICLVVVNLICLPQLVHVYEYLYML